MAGTLSIGQLAGRTGVAASTLRYYEKIGLLPGPARVGGQRRYDESVIARLEVIALCKVAGFALDEIALLFADDAPGRPASRALAQSKLHEIDARMKALLDAKRVIEWGMACRCPSIDSCTCGVHPAKPGFLNLPLRQPPSYSDVTSVTRKGAAMRIADILRGKGSEVATVTATTTVTGLLAELAVHNIGAMVVIDADGMRGIVSERDIVRRLQTDGPDLLRRPVADIMSAVAVTCGPEDPVDDLAALMTNNRVRHVPVLDGGRLVGIVSIGDVVKHRMEELQAERQQLQAYITGG